MIYALAIVSLAQTALLCYLFRRLINVVAENNGTARRVTKVETKLSEVRCDLFKLKNPPKYAVGDSIKGYIVYEVKFITSGMAGSNWVYRAIKGTHKKEFYDSNILTDYWNQMI